MNKISFGLFHKVLGILLVSSLLLAGCSVASVNPESTYETISNPTLMVGDPLPAPSEEVILTVTGAIDNKNTIDAATFDISTLEKLGLVQYKVSDPWLNAENTYTGVLVSDFLKFVGAARSASTLTLTALDDYQVDIAIADLQKWPVLLATQVNGEYITIDNNGPTRIIFPYDTYPDIDPVAYKDLWIWNIKGIEVR